MNLQLGINHARLVLGIKDSIISGLSVLLGIKNSIISGLIRVSRWTYLILRLLKELGLRCYNLQFNLF